MQLPTPPDTAHPAAAGAPLIFPRLSGLYARAEPAAYALLRGVFGVVLMTHGLPKLLRTSHGSMADPMAGSIQLIENVLRLPAAPALALFVALLEGVGGALLAIGLGTRAIAAMVTVQMLAICVALGPTWPWIDRGIEFPFLMMFLAIFMAFKGSGPWSLDRALGREL
ncbi:DoxX family protein [Pseudoxanthomonas winnipegensis]|jgi:putative oxidoreductase|uniref:DoxX family protein n=1 Tax=Pseudoxanthomonas winnipegensis TaxID=2480810 RepID=A0A4Q8L4D3_9GAMM|nr:DoxX family protein [Pseudoxanthomonas winnipegensis]TAA20148.1 DoxX family protein [Pseudoxanthomonas winnipegensis]